MKHAIMCTEEGLVAAHGILQKNSEEEVRFFAGGNWPNYMLTKKPWNIEVAMQNIYLFQVAGPNSLETLQRATGENLNDIKFLRFRDSVIAGLKVEIGRVGMSGNLAYEVGDRWRRGHLSMRRSARPARISVSSALAGERTS